MKTVYLVFLVVAIYFIQFAVLPFFGLHFNVFVPFALGWFAFEKKISRIFVPALVFDFFGGLPFPLMTVSLFLTFETLFILYIHVSEDSDFFNIAVVLPTAVVFFWLFVYLTGLSLGLFWDKFSLAFGHVFDLSFLLRVVYWTAAAAVFYAVFKFFSSKPSIYA